MSFEQFIISQRIYCELCDWGKGQSEEAMHVLKEGRGQFIAVCDSHAHELEPEKFSV